MREYIDLLINETDYNIRTCGFYQTHPKVHVNVELFTNVTLEYIQEHLNDFLLEKYK